MAEHSVFGATVPAGTLTIHADAAPEAATAHQFLNASAESVDILRVRWLVPAGASGLIGSSRAGFVGIMVRDDIAGPAVWPDPVAIPGGAWSPYSQVIVEGWNEFTLDAPITLPVGWWVIAAINIEGWYAYSTDVTQSPIPALDGSGLTLVGATQIDGNPARTYYDSDYVGSGSFTAVASASRWFGVDLVVEAAAAPAQGSGSAAWDVTVAATGQRDPEGSGALGYTVTVGATGERDPQGSGALSYDVAVAASGARAPRGAASAGYLFTVAAGGRATPAGSAALGYVYTVAATGEGGDGHHAPWPSRVYLIAEGYASTLVAEGYSLGITAEGP